MDKTIPIALCYATVEQQWFLELELPSNSTVEQALEIFKQQAQWPSLLKQPFTVGIFGEVVANDRLLQAGDRLEIYRPLVQDPKDARRHRAKYFKKR